MGERFWTNSDVSGWRSTCYSNMNNVFQDRYINTIPQLHRDAELKHGIQGF